MLKTHVVWASTTASFLGILLTGCATADSVGGTVTAAATSATQSPDEQCQKLVSGTDYGEQTSNVLEGAESTAAAVYYWQENRDAPEITGITSPLRAITKPTDLVWVCAYSGLFTTPAGPSGRQHTELTLVFLPDGSPELDSSGFVDNFHSLSKWISTHPSPNPSQSG